MLPTSLVESSLDKRHENKLSGLVKEASEKPQRNYDYAIWYTSTFDKTHSSGSIKWSAAVSSANAIAGMCHLQKPTSQLYGSTFAIFSLLAPCFLVKRTNQHVQLYSVRPLGTISNSTRRILSISFHYLNPLTQEPFFLALPEYTYGFWGGFSPLILLHMCLQWILGSS